MRSNTMSKVGTLRYPPLNSLSAYPIRGPRPNWIPHPCLNDSKKRANRRIHSDSDWPSSKKFATTTTGRSPTHLLKTSTIFPFTSRRALIFEETSRSLQNFFRMTPYVCLVIGCCYSFSNYFRTFKIHAMNTEIS